MLTRPSAIMRSAQYLARWPNEPRNDPEVICIHVPASANAQIWA